MIILPRDREILFKVSKLSVIEEKKISLVSVMS